MYALFKDGRQVSKAHSTPLAVLIEAFECGAMTVGGGRICMSPAYQIRRI